MEQDASTGALLREVARLHAHLQRTSVACCAGTTVTQCTVLTELGRSGQVPLAELSRRIGFDKSWTSRAVEHLVLASSIGWLILYVVVYGTAYGAFSPLRASVMADHFGRRTYGSITAVQGIPVAVCAGMGPLAAGWLYDVLHHYEVAFWLCAATFLLAAIGIAFAPRPKEQDAGSGQAGSVREEVAMGGSAIEQ
jgi:MFS family permease